MFKLMTDTSANLEPDVISAYDIGVIPFNYYLNGDERTCMDIAAFDGKAYYNAIRSGAKASTSQVPPQRYIEYMEPVLKQGLDILFIGMSSGISGSYSSAETAASELREQYPERKIITVDTLIKPLLKGDGEGKIVCFQKVRGKKNALKAIAAKYDELVENAADQIVGIAHADCSDDAAALAEMIRVKNPPKQIMTVCYEPVTGAHVGPGALALFFIGRSREAI